MKRDYFTYPARVTNVVDGDTLDVEVDLGFRVNKNIRIRLMDVDTAEIYGVKKDTEEYQRGMEQKEFVEDFVDTDSDEEWPITVRTLEETGKYGRWLAYIWVDRENLSKKLIEEWPEVDATA